MAGLPCLSHAAALCPHSVLTEGPALPLCSKPSMSSQITQNKRCVPSPPSPSDNKWVLAGPFPSLSSSFAGSGVSPRAAPGTSVCLVDF